MATVLFPLPNSDFDPTETGVPWRVLRQRGHRVVFATPDGKIARADPRLITGEGLGILATFMKADDNGRSAYEDMSRSGEFQHPVSHRDIHTENLDALILPGGHASGMRPYLESNQLQSIVTDLFEQNRPVGAICHGVLLAARSRAADGKSVLFGRKTTALTKIMELTAWALTCLSSVTITEPIPSPLRTKSGGRLQHRSISSAVRSSASSATRRTIWRRASRCETEIIFRRAGRAIRTGLPMSLQRCWGNGKRIFGCSPAKVGPVQLMTRHCPASVSMRSRSSSPAAPHPLTPAGISGRNSS